MPRISFCWSVKRPSSIVLPEISVPSENIFVDLRPEESMMVVPDINIGLLIVDVVKSHFSSWVPEGNTTPERSQQSKMTSDSVAFLNPHSTNLVLLNRAFVIVDPSNLHVERSLLLNVALSIVES